MVANFDNIRNGLDFGYATDPLAFVRWHYDKKKKMASMLLMKFMV